MQEKKLMQKNFDRKFFDEKEFLMQNNDFDKNRIDAKNILHKKDF